MAASTTPPARRPLTVGGVIREAFDLYGANAAPLLWRVVRALGGTRTCTNEGLRAGDAQH